MEPKNITNPLIFINDKRVISDDLGQANNTDSVTTQETQPQTTQQNDPDIACVMHLPKFYNNPSLNCSLSQNTGSTTIPTLITYPPSVSIAEQVMSGLIIDGMRKSNEASIRVAEQKAKNDDKIKTKRESKEIDEEAENRKDVKHPIIFKGGTGELFYYFDNGKKRSSPTLLLDIDSFSSVMYSATDLNGVTTQILTFNWRPRSTSNEGRSIYLHLDDGISATKIINLLTVNGLKLLTSGRKQKELAETLLNYCINNSQVVELPYAYGWNLLSDGTWKFAHEDELTIFLIIKNHFMKNGGTKNGKLI